MPRHYTGVDDVDNRPREVPDMTESVPKVYEPVDHGRLDANDFRDFMFARVVRLWGEANPDFFKGMVIERQAAKPLAKSA